MSVDRPDVRFSNNLGTFAFRRCMLSVSDQWAWAGSAVKRIKSVGVQGFIERADFDTDSEMWHGILSARDSGQEGDLQLPWTVLRGVKIMSVRCDTGVWATHMPVSAAFTDDNPGNNVYTLNFFDLELHNPRLLLPVPNRRVSDQYTHHPDDSAGDLDHRTRPVRYRSGYRLFDIVLSGTLLLPTPAFPEGLEERVRMQSGSEFTFVNDLAGPDGLPNGYPRPFALADAVPQLAGSVDLRNVVLERTSLDWRPGRRTVDVTLNMVAQPQDYASGGLP